MTFVALTHRVQGLLYFSYWPKASETWRSVGALNAELLRITPLLVAQGNDAKGQASDGRIQVRARKLQDGWLIIVVNTECAPTRTSVQVAGLYDVALKWLDGASEIQAHAGKLVYLQFAPLEAKIYVSAGLNP